MAGDWIKWVKGLQDKPEVFRMSVELKIDRFTVAARLMAVWAWADDNIDSSSVEETGHASVTLGASQSSLIDALAGVSGFADSMTAAGWLVQRSGSLEFPNFTRHNGETAKQRGLAAKRQQKARAKNVTETSRKQRDKSVTREEKRREEIKGDTPLKPQAENEVREFHPCLDTDRFREVWARWEQHRREIRKPLKPTMVKSQLKKLASLGESVAMAILERAIANGWTGINDDVPLPKTGNAQGGLYDGINEFCNGPDQPR